MTTFKVLLEYGGTKSIDSLSIVVFQSAVSSLAAHCLVHTHEELLRTNTNGLQSTPSM